MTTSDADAPKVPGPDTFHDALRRFLVAMETTRDLIQFIHENQDEVFGTEAVFTRIATRLMPTRDTEQHREAASIVHGLVHERVEAVSARKENGDASPEEVASIVSDYGKRIRSAVADLTGHVEDNYYYGTVWARTNSRPPPGPILRSSLLMGAVSDFEVLVSAIVRAQLAARPEIMRNSEQKYSYQELEDFASLGDFREHVAEKMADGLLRGGFDDWMDWFAKRHKISIEGVTDCPAGLTEIFQRRHLLVHNAGVVNSLYLAKLKDLSDPPPVGKKLLVSTNYLSNAIETLTLAGVKLAFGTALKLCADDESTRSLDRMITNVAYELLRDGLHPLVRDITGWHLDFACTDSNRLVQRVNNLLARKQLEGLESVQADIEAWDTSSLAGRYSLVRLALLDQHAEAYALAQKLLMSEELADGEWHTWPVLEGVRTYGAANGVSKEPDFDEESHSDAV